MKGVCTSFGLVAASLLIAGADPALPVLEESATVYQDWLTHPATALVLEFPAEPEFRLGQDLTFTGLLVDCFNPQETWDMLDPGVRSRPLREPLPPWRMPLTPPERVGDPALHDPDFVFLRLNFP